MCTLWFSRCCEGMIIHVCHTIGKKNKKLRWYPQQPQRFMFTNLSEACCTAKRWNLLRNPVELDLAAPKPPRPSPEPSPEPDLALHQSLPDPSLQPSLEPSLEPSPEPC